MNTVIAVLLALGACALAAAPGQGDPRAEESQQKIYEIIRSHENRKFGEHGGHEYEEGEKQASRRRYGYLPLEPPVHHPAEGNIYRENVAAYAPKPEPLHTVSSPLGHHSHYAIIDPITKNHQYVTLEAPKPRLVAHPRPTYILEEEPHYVVPGPKIVSKPHYLPPAKDYSHRHLLDQSHHAPPAKDYSHRHLLDQSHHASGHGHYGDNSVHGESGHQSHQKHDVSGHKSHSSSAGHHDEHDHHHNRAHYERDRGYHYEKAYAYDRVRAHHDIGGDKRSHSSHRSHHGREGHRDTGDHGERGYSYFKKQDKAGGQGYRDYGLQYLSPHHHAHGK